MGNDVDRMGTKVEQTEEAHYDFLYSEWWFQHKPWQNWKMVDKIEV